MTTFRNVHDFIEFLVRFDGADHVYKILAEIRDDEDRIIRETTITLGYHPHCEVNADIWFIMNQIEQLISIPKKISGAYLRFSKIVGTSVPDNDFTIDASNVYTILSDIRGKCYESGTFLIQQEAGKLMWAARNIGGTSSLSQFSSDVEKLGDNVTYTVTVMRCDTVCEVHNQSNPMYGKDWMLYLLRVIDNLEYLDGFQFMITPVKEEESHRVVRSPRYITPPLGENFTAYSSFRTELLDLLDAMSIR